jgi:hypothetical protein
MHHFLSFLQDFIESELAEVRLFLSFKRPAAFRQGV